MWWSITMGIIWALWSGAQQKQSSSSVLIAVVLAQPWQWNDLLEITPAAKSSGCNTDTHEVLPYAIKYIFCLKGCKGCCFACKGNHVALNLMQGFLFYNLMSFKNIYTYNLFYFIMFFFLFLGELVFICSKNHSKISWKHALLLFSYKICLIWAGLKMWVQNFFLYCLVSVINVPMFTQFEIIFLCAL